ncbi:MAG: hypothetical protein ACPGRZ_03815 [Alphaproteobacteria bacterium]
MTVKQVRLEKSSSVGNEIQDNTTPIEKHYEKTSYLMGLTKGERFQAARRHKWKSRKSILAIVILSLYVFSSGIVLIVFAEHLTDIEKKLITFANVIMTSFILVFSVLENGKRHELRAEMFLKCAQGISEIASLVKLELDTGS